MRLTTFGALLVIAVSTACSDSGSLPSQPDGAPDVIGPIVRVEREPSISLLIGKFTGRMDDSLAIVGVGDFTTIAVRDASGNTRRGSTADLQAGVYVSVWVTGFVKKSNPGMYTGQYVEVGVR